MRRCGKIFGESRCCSRLHGHEGEHRGPPSGIIMVDLQLTLQQADLLATQIGAVVMTNLRRFPILSKVMGEIEKKLAGEILLTRLKMSRSKTS